MNANKIIVECEVPFLIRTDNPENDEFEFFTILADDYSAEIGFRMVAGGGKGPMTTAGGADEDRMGHMSTTHVRANLDAEFIDNIPEDVKSLPDSVTFQMSSGGLGELSYIAEEVTDCINKFISVYKTQTESYWMRNLLPHDIFDFSIVKIDDEGEKSEHHHKHTASVMEGMGSTLSDEKISDIRYELNNEESPSIYSRLQLKLRDQISLKEYALAVADSQRLMESWIKDAFEHLLKTVENHSQSDAIDTARHQDGSFKDFHDIRKMYDSKLGFDLEGTTEFQRWDNIAQDTRNKIIHEGYEPTKEEAVKAIQINTNLILRVKSEFDSYLPDNLLVIEEFPDDGIGRATMGED